ncbi:TadE/TadG family type IV pilus assembly protein [Thalassotalea sp. Y01]|uniref:TadE/TadG family type IV pilus assembly protein n=1 Tax=Thalassotalea sp. Y01 TaxID=2729613 RepID=UPI00145DE395|nr:TadE/TadG family type IV pilus assembly protein [Thalassotalea sp. Y01]NMP14875.1 pilus assembly protein [Thalassotalea sp. Y01]
MRFSKRQSGIYTVEFAIVGSVFLLLFFAAMEISRLMFTWNVLTEVSRRAARVATVCNLLTDTTDISTIPASTAPPSGVTSSAVAGMESLIPNLSAANIQIFYLTGAGTNATTLSTLQLVRVEIVNYQHDLLIPGLFITLNSPTFSTTLPAESMGATRWGYTSC